MTVLLYRTRGLADFLTAVPAYRAVRRAFPDDRVVLAAPAPLAPLVPLTGAVDRLAPTSRLGIPRRVRGAITAVNLHGRGPESHRVLQSLGPERLIAFACAEARRRRAGLGRGRARCGALGAPAAGGRDPCGRDRPPAGPTDGARAGARGHGDPSRRPVGAAPLAGGEVRPSRRGAQQARARRGVTGDARERPLAERVTHRAGLPPDRNLAGVLDVGALASLVHDAALVVCGDTAVGHLASAFATPSVVLFGARSPERCGPPRSPLHRALWRGDEVGVRSPHGHGAVGSLLAITVEDVLDAATGVLRAADDQRSGSSEDESAEPAGFETAAAG